jgi:ATP-binding cassette, subfamily C, bacterial
MSATLSDFGGGGRGGLDAGDLPDGPDPAAAPAVPKPRRREGGGAGRMPPGLRLRDHGVTPLFFATALLLTVTSQLATLCFILMILHMADGVVETQNTDTIYAFALVFLFLGLVSAMSVHFRWQMVAAAAERLGLRLQALTLQAAVRTAVQRDAVEGASLLQDIATVQAFMRSQQPMALFDVVIGILALGLMFYLDTALGLISVAGILAVIGIGVLLVWATRGLAREARKRLTQTSSELGGQLVHPDLMRGLGMLKATMLRWQPRYGAALAGIDRVKGRSFGLSSIEEIVVALYTMAVKVVVCLLIFQHIGTLGMLVAAMLISHMVVMPFGRLAKSWFAWSFAGQSWRRIRDALQDYEEPDPQPADPSAPPGLLIEDLHFHPPGRRTPIIGALTLRLAPGTIATVEGPNGVGKSTLVRLVLGLLRPTSGRVRLDGQDSWYADRTEFGRRVGYLPQDVQLLDAPVLQNIGRGAPDAPPEAVVEAARAAGAHEMIGRLLLGYQTPSGATSGLSAGQRRLVGLARALYGRPRLIVLDEPEVGLDGYARVAMRAAVRDVRARGGVVLIVTHESETWRDIADLRLLLAPDGHWRVQPAAGEPGSAAEDEGRHPGEVRIASLH